jgi:ubiquinone/menaquinone biosynthesis C-methylase UbiE
VLWHRRAMPPPPVAPSVAHMASREPAIDTQYDRIRTAWDQIASGYDEFVTPSHMALGEHALRRAGLHPGMRFLDVAAGSGALTVPAARLGAQVLATDVSSVMLERLAARARDERLDIETRLMDGHALELADERFDLSGSQFGVMLFPDMPRGVAELARVTRSEGRVVLVALGAVTEVEFFGFFVRAIQAAVPGFAPPLDPPPLPFQLQDPARVRGVLTEAGLKDVRVETTTERLEFPSGARLWDWLVNSNPVAGELLAELDLTRERIAVVRKALDAMVDERAAGSGTAVLTVPINIGIGTK